MNYLDEIHLVQITMEIIQAVPGWKDLDVVLNRNGTAVVAHGAGESL